MSRPHCKKSKTKQKPWGKAEAEVVVGEVDWKVSMIVFVLSPSNSTYLSIMCQPLLELFTYKRKNKKTKGLHHI